jgi:serine protease inhibitor
MSRLRAAVCLTIAITLAACSPAANGPTASTLPGSSNPPVIQPTAPPAANIQLARSDLARVAADPASALTAASAVNDFGFDLYRALLAQDGSTNAVISPASVAIAMAMARVGARGETAAQMDAVLRSLGASGHTDGINALDQALESRSGTFKDNTGKDQEVTLAIANAPFAQQDEQWQQAFLDTLAQSFGAGLQLVDYKANFEGARQLINGWVSDQTHERIPNLLAPGTLDAATRLVLVNAIYLKAPWLTPFLPEMTTTGDFTLADGSTVQVPMMAMQDKLGYASGDGWQAVELPYVGGSLAMDIVVPDDLAAYTQSLTADSFAQLTAALSSHEVALTMPRFDTETKADLADLLSALGMPLAFEPGSADFSGMTTQESLFISDVIHQANISVDEKGTEAAAATAVVMEASLATEVVHVDANRPFLFALRDMQTGAVLFLGQIIDPSAG